jgi:hypothetical protein
MKYLLIALGSMVLCARATLAEDYSCNTRDGKSCLQETASIGHKSSVVVHYRNGCEAPISVEAELLDGNGPRTEKLAIEPGQEGGIECNWPKLAHNCIRKISYRCVRQQPAPASQQPQTEANAEPNPACASGRSECTGACRIYEPETKKGCVQDCSTAEAVCKRSGSFKMPSLAQLSINWKHAPLRAP